MTTGNNYYEEYSLLRINTMHNIYYETMTNVEVVSLVLVTPSKKQKGHALYRFYQHLPKNIDL